MLTFGALVTLIACLIYVIDSIDEMTHGRPWQRGVIAACVYLALFSGFYAAMVLVP